MLAQMRNRFLHLVARNDGGTYPSGVPASLLRRKERSERVWFAGGSQQAGISMTTQPADCMIYDVRRLSPAKQLSAVLSMFDGLANGQAFIFVCDFDPARIEKKFAAFFASEHSWICVHDGPPIWEIEIGRRDCL
jgi:uncharacterized protein (DUF2249 family)